MFESFRGDFGYSYYGERRTSATIDISLAVVVYVCVLISIATIVAAAGIRGKARWYTLIRVVYSLAVGSTLLLCLFGDCWIDGIDGKVNVPYIYRSDAEISGEVGLNIGLQKINITLKGTFQGINKGTVKYNEAISFGAVGSITDFRDFLERGLPQPVLTVVEFFSIDTGKMRWGRSFATAGYFAKILLLTALSFWILANIIVCSVVFYGGVLFTLTGVTMVITSIVYHCLQPTTELRLFCSESEFHLHYGICFWSVLLIGIFTTIVGFIILFLDTKLPQVIQKFFLIEVQDDTEESHETQKTSMALTTPMYKKNDFRRQSAPTLVNSSYFSISSTDLNTTGTLYSVAEVEGNEMTPPLRRSTTNPKNLGNLRSSYSLESLRAFSERNSLDGLSKNTNQYKSNPIFQQHENTTASFTKKRISCIPRRLQSAMSLESLPTTLTETTIFSDLGEDNGGAEHIHINIEHTVSDANNDENVDISMFELHSPEYHCAKSQNMENAKYCDKEEKDDYKINLDYNEESHFRGIYIDMTSAYP